MEYDVVVWKDTLSDGSICYAAICPAVLRCHGQGDTEAEALAEVSEAVACFLELEPDRVKTGQAARDEIDTLLENLTAEGVDPWVCKVAHPSIPAPA